MSNTKNVHVKVTFLKVQTKSVDIGSGALDETLEVSFVAVTVSYLIKLRF